MLVHSGGRRDTGARRRTEKRIDRMCRVLLSTNKVALLPTITQSTATPTAACEQPQCSNYGRGDLCGVPVLAVGTVVPALSWLAKAPVATPTFLAAVAIPGRDRDRRATAVTLTAGDWRGDVRGRGDTPESEASRSRRVTGSPSSMSGCTPAIAARGSSGPAFSAEPAPAPDASCAPAPSAAFHEISSMRTTSMICI